MSLDRYKIAYIFGAGASAKALPTVRRTAISPGYNEALRLMADNLKGQTLMSGHCLTQDEFVTNLYWLADKGDEHGTPDTFAKFSQLKNDGFALRKIKDTLSLFFTIKQFVEKKKDPRYLQFLIKVLEPNGLFPNNIKILNWNYDFQMQLAAEKF